MWHPLVGNITILGHVTWHNYHMLLALLAGPINDILSVMVMYMWHVAKILVMVASIFIATSFLTRSVSPIAHTHLNCICCSFSTSVGKSYLSASPQILSTSSLESCQPSYQYLPVDTSCIIVKQDDPYHHIEIS